MEEAPNFGNRQAAGTLILKSSWGLEFVKLYDYLVSLVIKFRMVGLAHFVYLRFLQPPGSGSPELVSLLFNDALLPISFSNF